MPKKSHDNMGKKIHRCDPCCEEVLAIIEEASNNNDAEPIVVFQFDSMFPNQWSCKCRPGPGDCHPLFIDTATNRPFAHVVDDEGCMQHPTQVLSCPHCGAHSKGDITEGEAYAVRRRDTIRRMEKTDAARRWYESVTAERGKDETPYIFPQADPTNPIFDVEALLELAQYDQLDGDDRELADSMTEEEMGMVRLLLLSSDAASMTGELMESFCNAAMEGASAYEKLVKSELAKAEEVARRRKKPNPASVTAAVLPVSLALLDSARLAWSRGLDSSKVGAFARQAVSCLKLAMKADQALGRHTRQGMDHLCERLSKLKKDIDADATKKKGPALWMKKMKMIMRFAPFLRPYAPGGKSSSDSSSGSDLDEDGDDPRKPAAAGPTTPRSKKPRQALTPRHT